MARPVGFFNEEKTRLFGIIKGLAGLGCCFATSKYLAAKMGCSEMSVSRYLKALREEGKIEVKTGKPGFDKKEGRFYRKRIIRVKYAQPELKRRVEPQAEAIRVITVPEPVHGFADRELKEANDRLEAERAAYEAAVAASARESHEADGFDYNEVLRQMQAELAAEGIEMELWEHHIAK